MRELILYATPTDDLGTQCAAYFEAVKAIGATTAQTYPPHCTLTGFFGRSDDRVPEVVTECAQLLADIGPIESGDVEAAHRVEQGWVGLELQSARLVEVINHLSSGLSTSGDEEPVRPKSWLHLSLAYDVEELGPYVELAHRLIDPEVAVAWELGLWERSGSDWRLDGLIDEGDQGAESTKENSHHLGEERAERSGSERKPESIRAVSWHQWVRR